jgi:hypothetical protein
MRPFILAAVSVLALAACSRPTEPAAAGAEAPAAVAETATPAASDEHAGHDMSGHTTGPMDEAMAKADASDDAAVELTPDNHTFHTYPAKTETVRLPNTEGGFWSLQGEVPANVALTGTGLDAMPDGSKAFAARFEMKTSGNSTVVFERRGSENATDPVLEARTINFMVH